MHGRFYDGASAEAHAAEVTIDGRDLSIAADGRVQAWPLREVAVDVHGGEARLSRRRSDARLILSQDDWERLARTAPRVRQHSAGGGRGLVIGLVALAVAVGLFVFVGAPMLSGPLARATPIAYEERMGESYNAQLTAFFPVCTGEEGQAVLADLGRRLGEETDSPFDIRVRAVQAPMVNAFALPGGYILVTDDLIAAADSPDELAAVVAHEVAHVDRRHVMQAVWRDLGAGMLLDLIVGGGSGAGQQAVLLAGQASQLSFGRAAETEADIFGMGYLHRAGLSSEGMAPFFERMAEQEADVPEGYEGYAEFLSTHPNTARRVAAARRAQRPGAAALGQTQWLAVRQACVSDQDEEAGRPWLELGRDRTPRNDPLPNKPDQVGQDR